MAHFLGVDHAGHRFGPSHPQMRQKLRQMNGILKQIIEAMEEDTILFVMGDHGMTADGNHGGHTEKYDQGISSALSHSLICLFFIASARLRQPYSYTARPRYSTSGKN